MPKSFHITFKPKCCNIDGNYMLQDKDHTTFLEFLKTRNSIKHYAKIEDPKTQDAHIHCAVLFKKNYRPENLKQQLLNRYKKYINFKITKNFNPAINVRVHPEDHLATLAGGYHCKDDGSILLGRKGFTDKELEDGNKKYDKFVQNKLRKRLIELHNKNFLQKLDEYVYLNDIDTKKLNTIHKFYKLVIIRMIRDGYIFTVSNKVLVRTLNQLILYYNQEMETDLFLDNEIPFESTIVDKQTYIKIICEQSAIY